MGNIVGSKGNTLIKQIPNEKETLQLNTNELKTENKKKLRLTFTMEKGVDYKRMRPKFYYILVGHKNLYQSELLSNTGVLNDVIIPISLISPNFTLQFYDQYKKLVQTNIYTPELIMTNACEIIPVILEKKTVKILLINHHTQCQ